MGSPFHVWWTVIWTSALVTIGWLVCYYLVLSLRDVTAVYVTDSMGIVALNTLFTVWNWFPVLWMLGILLWAFVTSQRKDREEFEYEYGT